MTLCCRSRSSEGATFAGTSCHELGRTFCISEGLCGDAEPTPEKLLEIRDLQQQDPSLVMRCRYLEHGQLPDGEQESRKLVLESRNYEVVQALLVARNRVPLA